MKTENLEIIWTAVASFETALNAMEDACSTTPTAQQDYIRHGMRNGYTRVELVDRWQRAMGSLKGWRTKGWPMAQWSELDSHKHGAASATAGIADSLRDFESAIKTAQPSTSSKEPALIAAIKRRWPTPSWNMAKIEIGQVRVRGAMQKALTAMARLTETMATMEAAEMSRPAPWAAKKGTPAPVTPGMHPEQPPFPKPQPNQSGRAA